ncbi:uncharacterized protein VTP21DRAFT_2960 [Calcarisporiella thermophila]|uniref:uncharacterized protein n=1 Tax=Calcarisporiella thermophila TaxID=911321 RepID=UPI003743A6BB
MAFCRPLHLKDPSPVLSKRQSVSELAKGDGSGGAGYPLSGLVRDYYIAAEEIEWDYTPMRYDRFHGGELNDTVARTFTISGPQRIGSRYKKAVYRAYTDPTFATRAPHEHHLGLLGPIVRAEVGDKIRIHFKNMASRHYSIHPHGVKYSPMSEGAYYSNTLNQKGARVPPGETHIYVWDVPERSGPGTEDASSMLHAYHSHVEDPADIFAGLLGPIIIYRRGMLDADGLPSGFIDQEVVTALLVTDENRSPYLADNIAKYTTDPKGVDISNPEFRASNFMENINGFMFNNLDELPLHMNSRVRWYVFSLGSTFDMHTAHWHGSSVSMAGHRMDVVDVFPASFRTVDMIPDNLGEWMFHCHVSDHVMKGMSIFYQVKESIDEDLYE